MNYTLKYCIKIMSNILCYTVPTVQHRGHLPNYRVARAPSQLQGTEGTFPTTGYQGHLPNYRVPMAPSQL